MFKKVKQNRMYEEIAEQIVESILRGDLAPGDKLPPEKKLSEMFGVSRVTVREAILSLEQQGLVEVRQGSRGGAYIKKMDLDAVVLQVSSALRMTNVTFTHLAEARAMLEEATLTKMKLSAFREEDLEALERNVDDAEIHFRNGENKERLITNFRFHTLIVERTRNPILILMHKLIVNLSLTFFENVEPTSSMIENTLKEHRKVVDLLRHGKYDQAGTLCRDHIRSVSKRIVEKSKRQSVFKSPKTGQPR
jgi:GntR family transcriptional regulator, transcriptional repressor for pyruvate dehydrogenase complex